MKKIFILSSLILISFLNGQLSTPNGAVSTTTNATTGNVGIGTTTPQAKLEINGDLKLAGVNSISPLLKGVGTSPNAGSLDFGDGTGWKFNIRKKSDASNLVTFSDRGNVGIGTSAPIAKLHVEGETYFNGVSTFNNPFILFDRADGPTYLKTRNPGGYFAFVTNGRLTNFTEASLVLMQDKSSIFNGNVAVQGKMEAKEVKVTLTPTADFVFAEDYKLPKLEEVEKHIKDKKHLPEIASAKEMEKEGVNIGEFQIKLLQKIEELTLYSIEQNKQLKNQSDILEQQKQLNEKLEIRLNQLENTK